MDGSLEGSQQEKQTSLGKDELGRLRMALVAFIVTEFSHLLYSFLLGNDSFSKNGLVVTRKETVFFTFFSLVCTP